MGFSGAFGWDTADCFVHWFAFSYARAAYLDAKALIAATLKPP
jgi:hypothetical protein